MAKRKRELCGWTYNKMGYSIGNNIHIHVRGEEGKAVANMQQEKQTTEKKLRRIMKAKVRDCWAGATNNWMDVWKSVSKRWKMGEVIKG